MTLCHMWIEFVLGSHPCSERFFSGYSSSPLFTKTNISKFQFYQDYCESRYHEPLALEIAQALPILLTIASLYLLYLFIIFAINTGVH